MSNQPEISTPAPTDTETGGASAASSCSPSLDCSREEFLDFIRSLQPGERVIERGVSGMTGETGVVVIGRDGLPGVRWDTVFRDGVGMVTSVTGGTRRIS